MRLRPSLLAIVAFFSLLFGCGSGGESSDGGAEGISPDSAAGSASSEGDGGSESSDGCPTGRVRIVSKMQHYDPFCAQPCTSTSTCPAGMACVLDFYGIPDPGIPVCVSDSVPPPLSTPMTSVHIDGARSGCSDSMTMTQQYVNPKTGIVGYERIACPQGCQATSPGDAGGYLTTARCL